MKKQTRNAISGVLASIGIGALLYFAPPRTITPLGFGDMNKDGVEDVIVLSKNPEDTFVINYDERYNIDFQPRWYTRIGFIDGNHVKKDEKGKYVETGGFIPISSIPTDFTPTNNVNTVEVNITAFVRDMNGDGFPDVQVSRSVDVEPGFDLVTLVSKTRPVFQRGFFGNIERHDDLSTPLDDPTEIPWEIGTEFAGYTRVEYNQ